MSKKSHKLLAIYSCFCILGIIFILLKIFGAITWPWIWTTAPIWMPLASGILFILVIVIVVISQRRKRLGIDD
jgi:membrane protein YdbS with pleckstrin-like domain